MKVLISAYACSPYKGSESGAGWGFVSALSKYHEIWVIVEEEKFREDIERIQAADPDLYNSIRFFFIQKQRNRWLRKLWPPSYYWYYKCWHKDAYHLAQKLHQEVGFDLAHQLTMVGFREPGFLWELDIPFVWGPVGGMGRFPWRFLPVVGAYGAVYYIAYNLLNWLHANFLRRPRLAANSAASGTTSGLIAATPENRDAVEKFWACRSTVLTEVGLPSVPVADIRQRVEGEALRIVWTGLHIPRKALNLGLNSLSKLPANVNWELHILGDGRQTKAWRRLADSLGISSACHFHGWVSRDRALEVMQDSHLMLITSLRDLTSTVTIEALALGLPIICLDHCGFAEVVNESCGVKIPMTSPNEVIKLMTQAIERLAADEPKRQKLARGALLRAADFSWDKKAKVIDRIYRSKVAAINHDLHGA